MNTVVRFREDVRQAVGDRSLTGTAIRLGLPREAIRSVLKGHEPLLSRAGDLAHALGFEFQLGPGDGPKSEAAPAWMARLHEEMADLRREVVQALDESARRGPDIDVRHIPLRDIDLAAGAGAVVESEEVVGHLAFSADWLKQRGIDSENASIVRVTGRSMEPTLLEGSSVLVDETRRRRRAGEIFAVRRADGGVVKRLGKDARGGWLLTSDNPRYDPVPWGPGDELVGQVRWTARVL